MPSKTTTTNRVPAAKKSYGQGLVKEAWDFTTSTGALLLIQEPDIDDLMSAGILDSVDPLTGTVQGFTIPKAEGGKVVDTSQLLQDPKKLQGMLDMIDTIVLKVVVQPEILPSPRKEDGTIDTGAMDRDKYYIHQLSITVKSEIMDEAMKGMKDFDTFRTES